MGYPAAFDNAGSLLLHDRGCRQHCVNEAVKLFIKGAALGDPDSMVSLADQINNGQATGNMIALYQRAAKLGHPRAIRVWRRLPKSGCPRAQSSSPFRTAYGPSQMRRLGRKKTNSVEVA
jgi:hypothetical protein